MRQRLARRCPKSFAGHRRLKAIISIRKRPLSLSLNDSVRGTGVASLLEFPFPPMRASELVLTLWTGFEHVG